MKVQQTLKEDTEHTEKSNESFFSTAMGILSNGWLVLLILPLVLNFLCGWNLFGTLLLTYLLSSLLTLMFYWADKRFAEDNLTRIPESNLHLWEFFFGWPGALFAQRKFHHKNKKISFQVAFWLCVIANVTVIGTWIYLAHK